MKEQIAEWQKFLKDKTAEEVISFAIEKLGESLAFATSLAIEDQVVTEMITKITPFPFIFTLDTGRLFQETYDTIENTSKRYGIKINIMFPDNQEIEEMVNNHGINLFYDSVEKRKLCCKIRKINQLQRALSGKKGWITGQRQEQSITRYGLNKVEWDETNLLIKFNPIADWTEQQVWHYIKTNNIPYNHLQEQGYRSIGCLPCTRPVAESEDFRAGRWWWEKPENKECGLHKGYKGIKV